MKKRLKGLGALVLVLAMMLACVVPAMAYVVVDQYSGNNPGVYYIPISVGVNDAEAGTVNVDKTTGSVTAVAGNGYHFVNWDYKTNYMPEPEQYSETATINLPEDNSSSGYLEYICAVFAPNFGEGGATEQPDNRIPSWIFGGSGAGSNPFTDVLEGSWFADAVIDMNARGIMTGTAPDTFSSETAVSRAQLVTALWRLEGQPMGVEHAGFPDVDMDSWYGYAVDWAAAFDIVEGYDGLFHPEAPVTREQMAAILYRYTQYVGGDMLGAADLSGYTDAGDISDYAAAAMQWAVAQGLMEGSDSALNPQGELTRAQMAVILSRYLSK